MTKFLVGIIIALLLFIPACKFVSEFFRTSLQAKENFGDFVTKLDQFNNEPDLAVSSFVLVMDKGTAITYMPEDSNGLIVDIVGDLLRNFEAKIWRSSTTCSFEKSCLCLIRDYQIEDTGGNLYDRGGTIEPENPACFNTDLKLKFSKCGYGVPRSIQSYTCEGGGWIERLLVKEVKDEVRNSPTDSHYELPRRISLQLKKQGEQIVIDTR